MRKRRLHFFSAQEATKSKRSGKKSLRGRLLAAITILCVGISAVFGTVSAVMLYQNAQSNMLSSVNSNTEAYGSAVQQAIENFKMKVEAIAKDTSISDQSQPLEKRKERMKQLAEQYGFVQITVANKNGIDTSNIDVNDREYFKQAMQGKTYITSTLTSKADSSVILMAASKINSGADFEGVVIVQLSSDTFSKMIDAVSVGENGYGFIVDNTGKIIAHKDRDKVNNFVNYIDEAKKDGSYSEIASVVTNMIHGKKSAETVTMGGKEECIGYEPLTNTDGWSIAVSADVSEMMGSFRTSIAVTVIITVLFIIISVILSVRIADSVAKPISSLVERIERLALGDLHTEVPEVKTKDEIGVLAESFTSTVSTLQSYVDEISEILNSIENSDLTMMPQQDYRGDFVAIRNSLNGILKGLNATFLAINQSAEQVAGGAVQVSDAAQALSQGATEQASSIEELSASITEIAEQVNQNASNAAQANQNSQLAFNETERGNQQMQEMISAMNQISDTSGEIGKIIKTIEDIAFQTNILALNAAVEAARAGAAGKGFAVVADEVRNLASKSAEAAKNTTVLIENSLRAVNNGSQIAQQTAVSLTTIVDGVQKTSDLVGEIAQASNFQATAVNQVMTGVDQISAVVQTNSATSEETAATSEELNAQAQTLKEMISAIKLRGRESAPNGENYSAPTGTFSGEDDSKY